MYVYPDSAPEKLGFGVVRARLAGHALSVLGEALVAKMRPSQSTAWVREELQRVDEMRRAQRFGAESVPLRHVLDVADALRRAAPERAVIDPEDLVAIRLTSITARLVRAYFRTHERDFPALKEATDGIEPVAVLEDAVARVLTDDAAIRNDASPALVQIRRGLQRRRSALQETLKRELQRAVAGGHAAGEQATVRGGRAVIPIRAESKRKVPGVIHDTSSTGQTVFIEPAAALEIGNEVRELEAEERREIERLLRELTGRVREYGSELRGNQRALARFDLWHAKARLAHDLGANVPDVVDAPILDLKAARHPALVLLFQDEASRARRNGDRRAKPREVVPLDLALGEAYRTLVITGPNAGGKSVALKTAGLLALMLAHGLPLPAAQNTRIGLFGRLLVDIGDAQSMEDDLSTFSSHVANLRVMLKNPGEDTLVLIDEAGTGTDPAEGGALAQAVLEHLTESGARTIVTTHHGTLKVFAHEAEGVENGSMAFDQATLSPTYRFQAGIPGSSYAFDVARRTGLGENVLARAASLVGEQQTALEDLIASFEAKNQALARQLAAAEKSLAKAEHQRRTFEGRANKLKKEEDAIREQALEEAERIVKGANAEVERTIREIKEAQAAQEQTKAARENLGAFRDETAEQQERLRQQQARREKKRERRTKPPQPTAAKPEISPAPGPIAVGDQVVLDGGSSAGEVLEIRGKNATVASGALKLKVKLDRLTKVGGKRKQQVTVKEINTGGGAASRRAMNVQRRIDLRGQRVDAALGEVQRLVDDAVAANLKRVEILHGTGTGALRAAIREVLGARADVAGADDAPWDEGGPGVTVVTLA